MEQDWFTFEGWDELDVLCHQYYDCILKRAIGEYPIGTPVSIIIMNYGTGVCELRFDNATSVEFKMSLSFTRKDS
jgi:hypothetical protein